MDWCAATHRHAQEQRELVAYITGAGKMISEEEGGCCSEEGGMGPFRGGVVRSEDGSSFRRVEEGGSFRREGSVRAFFGRQLTS